MTESEAAAVSGGLMCAKTNGVQILQFRHLLRRPSPIRDILSFFEIVRVLNRTKPQVLHTHSSKAGVVGRLAAKVTRTPIVIHTPHGHVFYGHFGAFASKLFLLIERLMDRFTDTTIALTQGERDDYVKLRVTTSKKLVKIHSGVELDRFSETSSNIEEMRQAIGLGSLSKVVGTVGWLLPIKGPDILLKAMMLLWTDCPEVHLVFVGKGEMQNELMELSKTSGNADRVHFLGWREDVWSIMPMLDIFVLPSRNEGMGRVIVEAMAAGRPVVASNVGGIPDLVEDGVNGLLFPSEDVPALAEAIGSLIEDPGKAHRMGLIGKLKSREYSTEAMVQKLDGLYRRLVFNHQSRGAA
ncbi:MAG: glycosyltransferase family 4 protein [Pseudomonadota bacterium]